MRVQALTPARPAGTVPLLACPHGRAALSPAVLTRHRALKAEHAGGGHQLRAE